MSNRNSMDIDREPANGNPSSPPPQSSPVPSGPSQSTFTVPVTNGAASPVTSPVNGNGDGDVPVPPPHKSNPSSPKPTPEDEAEEFKNAGNKFFKEKDYQRAIAEYTKGTLPSA